jgi:hypothetical protein
MDEEEANRALKALDVTLQTKKRQIEYIKNQIETCLTHKANLAFQWERERIKKQESIWWILIVSLFILKIACFVHGKYVLGLVCEYSFLALWRGLYLKHTKHARPVAICTITLTLYLF